MPMEDIEAIDYDELEDVVAVLETDPDEPFLRINCSVAVEGTPEGECICTMMTLPGTIDRVPVPEVRGMLEDVRRRGDGEHGDLMLFRLERDGTLRVTGRVAGEGCVGMIQDSRDADRSGEPFVFSISLMAAPEGTLASMVAAKENGDGGVNYIDGEVDFLTAM